MNDDDDDDRRTTSEFEGGAWAAQAVNPRYPPPAHSIAVPAAHCDQLGSPFLAAPAATARAPGATGYSDTRGPRGITAPVRADRRKRHTTVASHCTCTSMAIFLLQFAPPLTPLLLSTLFSPSARGPGRGGTAVGRDGPDPPSDSFFFCWYRIPLRKLHGARGPPSDQTPFFVFVFVFVFLCRGSS